MIRVRCAFTSCKNNIQNRNGYFCTCKEIHIFSYWNNTMKHAKALCEQYKNKEEYYPSIEMQRKE